MRLVDIRICIDRMIALRFLRVMHLVSRFMRMRSFAGKAGSGWQFLRVVALARGGVCGRRTANTSESIRPDQTRVSSTNARAHTRECTRSHNYAPTPMIT